MNSQNTSSFPLQSTEDNGGPAILTKLKHAYTRTNTGRITPNVEYSPVLQKYHSKSGRINTYQQILLDGEATQRVRSAMRTFYKCNKPRWIIYSASKRSAPQSQKTLPARCKTSMNQINVTDEEISEFLLETQNKAASNVNLANERNNKVHHHHTITDTGHVLLLKTLKTQDRANLLSEMKKFKINIKKIQKVPVEVKNHCKDYKKYISSTSNYISTIENNITPAIFSDATTKVISNCYKETISKGGAEASDKLYSFLESNYGKFVKIDKAKLDKEAKKSGQNAPLSMRVKVIDYRMQKAKSEYRLLRKNNSTLKYDHHPIDPMTKNQRIKSYGKWYLNPTEFNRKLKNKLY